MVHKFLLFLFCLLLMATPALSQTNGVRKAYKVPEKNCEALKVKIDNFVTLLNSSPGTSGSIIIYEGSHELVTFDGRGRKKIRQILPGSGEINYQINAVQEILKNVRVAPIGKVDVINGGFRKKFAIEFWTVPKGAEPPDPTPDVKRMKYRKGVINPQAVYLGC